MRLSLAGVAATVALTLSPVAHADLSSAQAGCYIDTPAFDVLRPNSCFTVGRTRTTALFGVLGLDQSGGRYTVQYLDGTCTSIFYTTQEGWVCSRPISVWQTITQRVRVIDNQTGFVSPILSATATYESNQ